LKHKKQSFQQLQEIFFWNQKRGNLPNQIDVALEHYMLLEELYEGMGIPNPKTEAKAFMASLLERDDLIPVSETELLDSIIDLQFISHGTLYKMNLSPEQSIDAMQAVIDSNNSKGSKKDTSGKIIKDLSSFVPPEPALQQILNQRT